MHVHVHHFIFSSPVDIAFDLEQIAKNVKLG